MSVFYDYIKEFLMSYGFNVRMSVNGAAFITFLFIVIIALLVFLVLRKIVVKIIGKLVLHTSGIWDDTLFDHRFFHVLSHLIPAVLIYASANYAGEDIIMLPQIIRGVAHIYLAIVVITAINRFLNASMDIYNTYPYSKDRPIKGYIQLVKIFIYFFGAIFIISVIIDQNPANLFAGLGALAAVLMLVFKDPILGFVASIQLAANNMVKPGDWITLPRYNVDGTIYDISLTTVKIQNWDKSITMIPTYSLVSDPVTNWIGMYESGGRRIQRSVNIDILSIRIADDELISKINKIQGFKEFVNIQGNDNPGNLNKDQNAVIPNIQISTNLSLFMKYIDGFCRTHQGLHENMTRMVRLLQSNEKGLPLEIIVFSKSQQADLYEALQAEIFNHIFAVLPEFGLRVFQNPTGNIPFTGN